MSTKTAIIQDKDLMGEAFKRQLKLVLPKHLTPDRICRIALNEFRNEPKLRKCSKMSFFSAIMKCCELGLEPSSALGHVYLVPYKEECSIIIGYKGFLHLVRQSDKISTIYSRCVYENDFFEIQYGTQESINHVPAQKFNRDRGSFIGVYAVGHYLSGVCQFEMLWAADIERIKARSPYGRNPNSPWVRDYDIMCMKSSLRRLCKFLPTSTKLQEAISLDELGEIGKQKLDSGIVIENDDKYATQPKIDHSNDPEYQIMEKLSNTYGEIKNDA